MIYHHQHFYQHHGISLHKKQDYNFYDTDISLQVLERGYKVSTIDIEVRHYSKGQPPKNFDILKKPFFEKWNKKVHGEWPISRLSTFYKD